MVQVQSCPLPSHHLCAKHLAAMVLAKIGQIHMHHVQEFVWKNCIYLYSIKIL